MMRERVKTRIRTRNKGSVDGIREEDKDEKNVVEKVRKGGLKVDLMKDERRTKI